MGFMISNGRWASTTVRVQWVAALFTSGPAQGCPQRPPPPKKKQNWWTPVDL